MRPGKYKRHENHEFFDVGIGRLMEYIVARVRCMVVDNYKVKTLSMMMRDMDVDRVDMVRMDTEGAEWGVSRLGLFAGG